MTLRRLREADGLAQSGLILATAVAAALLFARQPSFFLIPQFYAEDGRICFSEAYNSGWLHALPVTYSGYLIVVQRLGAAVSLLAPLRWAPLPNVLWGLMWQVWPVTLLLSKRCRGWGPLPMRVAIAAVYIAIPNARELHVVCTNAQWHLALLAVLIAFAEPPETVLQRALDVLVLGVAALSGPFCLVLIPLVLIFWYVRRWRWTLGVLATLIAIGAVEFWAMQMHKMERILTASGQPQVLGATPALFVRILGGDVFRASLFGSIPYGDGGRFAPNLLFFVIGVIVCGYCLRYAGAEIRLFVAFCFSLLIAALRSPLVPPLKEAVWMDMVRHASSRYWFFPGFAFLFCVVWILFCARARVMRYAAAGLCGCLLVGITRDWKIPALPDEHYAQQVERFEQKPVGTPVSILITPMGWDMLLVRK